QPGGVERNLRRLRQPRRDRPTVPHRPPAGIRGDVDRPAGRGDRGRHPGRACAPHVRGGAAAVMGPSIAWYLSGAAFLFATGALGVLLRRNPLIVLLSLEIMLNGANLALIAFSRHYAQG